MLKVDPNEEKISLGMKQTEQDPWMVLPLKYPVGTRINGKVRNLTSFGAFVEIEPGIDGLIHISDMSWTKRVQHPSEVVKKGDAVDVVILNIDAENKRICSASSRPRRIRGSASARRIRSAPSCAARSFA